MKKTEDLIKKAIIKANNETVLGKDGLSMFSNHIYIGANLPRTVEEAKGMDLASSIFLSKNKSRSLIPNSTEIIIQSEKELIPVLDQCYGLICKTLEGSGKVLVFCDNGGHLSFLAIIYYVLVRLYHINRRKKSIYIREKSLLPEVIRYVHENRNSARLKSEDVSQIWDFELDLKKEIRKLYFRNQNSGSKDKASLLDLESDFDQDFELEETEKIKEEEFEIKYDSLEDI